ncbi:MULTISPECIES: DUF4091 domain-containing protein [unclassified Paenibacillus]|uniref:DUF4091 domain-containing protein n=1 Tax=unclassified Paenibacillus TaxID=185978 RepID=UPI003643998B
MHFGLQSMFYKYTWAKNFWDQGRKDTAVNNLNLCCNRRDSAALQAVVCSDVEDFVLAVSKDSFFWKGGPLKIVRMELEMEGSLTSEVKLVGFIEDDDRSQKSDVLLEDRHVFVSKRQIQQVWLEFEAGENTPAGSYEGKLKFYSHTLFEDEVLEKELTFTVTVNEQQLPEAKDYTFYLDLWQHNCNIARKYKVEYWSDEHFGILEHYLQKLADLGQKALSVLISESAWNGQQTYLDREPHDLFEYSIVPVRRASDGTFFYDFSFLDRYIALGEKYGITSEIEIFGLLNNWQYPDAGYGAIVEGYPDAIRIRYYDEAGGCYRFMREVAQVKDYISALETHCVEKEWIDRVRIVADEPADWELFQQRMTILREAAPAFSYKTAINHVEFIRKEATGIKDYVPLFSAVVTEYEHLQSMRPLIPGKLVYYVCCEPSRPNTFLKSPSIEARVIPWMVEKLKLDGFLRWNYTAWTDQPLESIICRPTVWPAGDTNFVYPGPNGKPLLSLRYKWLQRGIRDYEFMQLLKQSGRGDQVERALQKVFRFQEISDLHENSGIPSQQLYSFEPDDYDELYRSGK